MDEGKINAPSARPELRAETLYEMYRQARLLCRKDSPAAPHWHEATMEQQDTFIELARTLRDHTRSTPL